jgi:hypothetical protein
MLFDQLTMVACCLPILLLQVPEKQIVKLKQPSSVIIVNVFFKATGTALQLLDNKNLRFACQPECIS